MSLQDFNPSVKKFPLKATLPDLPLGYPISAKVVTDSISEKGIRLTTLELVFPRYILAEFNTHRVFSRNASSSRAIPTKKLIQNSNEVFVEPVRYGKNKAGMQASSENLTGEDLEEARHIWKSMAAFVTKGCARLAELQLHKQWASRPLEWFGTIKVVVSSTSFDNFFWLRDHPEPQDEIIYLAQAMKTAMNESSPTLLKVGEWHIPYVTKEEVESLGVKLALTVSAARCARTSYKTHHGITSSLAEDMDLFLKLVHDVSDEDNPFHASPTEHQATPCILKDANDVFPNSAYKLLEGNFEGNFQGWRQHRKYIEIHGVDFPI